MILELKTLLKRKPLTLCILFLTASKSSLETTPLSFFSVWFVAPISGSYVVFKTKFLVLILFTFVTNPSKSGYFHNMISSNIT